MSFNFEDVCTQLLSSFGYGLIGFFLTLFAHISARYLVGPSIFPRVKTESPTILKKLFGFRQVAHTPSYNALVAGLMAGYFASLFSTLFPTLPVEQACAITLFSFTIAITIITDFYTYLISTLVTLYLIPAVFFYAHMGYLKISLSESVMSTVIVGVVMTLINFLYEKKRGTPAFGEGDRDLLMYIAAFLGWFSTLNVIFYGSLIGSAWGIIAVIRKQATSFSSYILPFGTCLGFGVFIRLIILYGNSPLTRLIP